MKELKSMKKWIEKLINKDKRIDTIELQDGTMREDIMGLLWLNDGWVLNEDGSHCIAFYDKRDLINILKNDIVKE